MNQLDLNGRNAVVTGGASGLGFAIAERLVASGANVVIWDLNGKAAQAAGKQLGAASIAADVRDPTSVRSAVQKTLGHVPRIDILINNAGISGPNAKLWEYPVEDWKRIFAVNVEGTFYCCRTVVPLMREQNYGRIVNIASVAGKDGNPNASAYSASKAAVIALTKSLGKELADTLVRVNCVTPAAVRTPLFAQMTQAHIDYAVQDSSGPVGGTAGNRRARSLAGVRRMLVQHWCGFRSLRWTIHLLNGGRYFTMATFLYRCPTGIAASGSVSSANQPRRRSTL
jgi:2-dehydro-3-deoxy-L-rhamnonate dehydrogenase (NAD+)